MARTGSFFKRRTLPGVLRQDKGADYYRYMTRSDCGRTTTPHTLQMLAILLAMAVLAPALWAQDGAVGDDRGGSVFAPFVSRLRLSTRDPEVRLTWEDSDDVDGKYEIYRHTSEINASTFLDAQLIAEVEPGVQSFIDTPALPGEYYYGVLGQSATGDRFEIFIPYRNTTFVAVAVENVATLVERSTQVRGIQAIEADGLILVEYESDQVGRELIIYRSTRPLASVDDLISAGVVATVMSTVESVIDYPVPGVPYYYGVVDSALVAEGSATFEPGSNATIQPTEVPLPTAVATRGPEPEPAPPTVEEQPAEVALAPVATEPEAAPAIPEPAPAESTEGLFVPAVSRRRPLPLPFLQLNTDLRTGNRLGDAGITVPEWRAISDQTQDSVDTMLARLGQSSVQSASPEVLPVDTLPSPRGAEFTLRTILEGPFASLAWEETLRQLTNFLTLPLPDDIRSRALFYRAQCYYFTGDSQRAFVEFLLARDEHFAEVEGWLDVILASPAGA
jgi:hypothetical protein